MRVKQEDDVGSPFGRKSIKYVRHVEGLSFTLFLLFSEGCFVGMAEDILFALPTTTACLFFSQMLSPSSAPRQGKADSVQGLTNAD